MGSISTTADFDFMILRIGMSRSSEGSAVVVFVVILTCLLLIVSFAQIIAITNKNAVIFTNTHIYKFINYKAKFDNLRMCCKQIKHTYFVVFVADLSSNFSV